jgi:hypothetical protein
MYSLMRIYFYIVSRGFSFYDVFVKILRGIFGPKSYEVTIELEKLHTKENHKLYSSPNFIRQIKSRLMRWAGHVERMGEERRV